MSGPRRYREQVPVVILAGFLGSGKTTVVNHLLRNANGVRIGVVVNDFGKINVDAMLVAGQTDAVRSLSDGCLCCAVDASGLDRMLDRLTQPKSKIDVVVIEASGVAEPRELVRMLLASENPRVGYGGLIEVVDAVEFEDATARHPELADHVRFADLVVLNKTDRLDADDTDRVRATVTGLAEGRPVLPTAHGRLDPALLFDAAPRRPREDVARQLSFDELVNHEDHEDHDHSGHLHAAYDSVSYRTDRLLDPRRFLRFLDARPAGLYRVKGFVRFGVDDQPTDFTMQTVGDFVDFTHARRGARQDTELVLIGAGIDGDKVRSELDDCRADDATAADHQGMLRVLRYAED